MNEPIVRKCLICGDRAISHSYGAISCQSCKTFFRRHALKNKKFKCFYQNKCKIDIFSRKFCQRCRLDKCLANGMKKKSIVPREEKRRARRRGSNINTVNDSSVAQIVKISNNSENTDNICNIENKSEFPRILRQLIVTFNEFERNRLKELFDATTGLRDPLNTEIITEITDFMDAFKVLQMRARDKCQRIVNTFRNISDFENMCENDKIALLKPACPEILCLVSVINFNFVGNYWTIPINENKATTLKLEMLDKNVSGNLFEIHRKFMQSLKEEYNSDINILDLLSAILLFNPKRQNLIHEDIVEKQQQFYIHLLQRYIELKCNSKCRAELKCVGLLNKLNDLYVLNRMHMQKFIENEPQNAGQLVNEIYDIKPRNALIFE